MELPYQVPFSSFLGHSGLIIPLQMRKQKRKSIKLIISCTSVPTDNQIGRLPWISNFVLVPLCGSCGLFCSLFPKYESVSVVWSVSWAIFKQMSWPWIENGNGWRRAGACQIWSLTALCQIGGKCYQSGALWFSWVTSASRHMGNQWRTEHQNMESSLWLIIFQVGLFPLIFWLLKTAAGVFLSPWFTCSVTESRTN